MLYGLIVGLLFTVGLQVLGESWTQTQRPPASPCPGIFQYQVEPGGIWYGLIHAPNVEPNFNVKLTVEMGINAILPSQYAGKIALVEHKNEVWRRLVTGDMRPVQYRVYFPLSWPLPVVKRIASNQNVLCFADQPSTITKLSLEHTLFPITLNNPAQIEANRKNPILHPENQNQYKPVEQTTKNFQLLPPFEPNMKNQASYQIDIRPDTRFLESPQRQPPPQTRPGTQFQQGAPQIIVTSQNAEDYQRFSSAQPVQVYEPINQVQPEPVKENEFIKPFQLGQVKPFQNETPNPFQPVQVNPFQPEHVNPFQFEPVKHIQSESFKPFSPEPVYNNITANNIPPPTTQRHTTTTSTTTQTPKSYIDYECGISVKGAVPLVVNGQPTSRGEWPWLVAMFIKSTSVGLHFQCGGTLLSKTIVLTAAHCVKYRGRPEVKTEAIVLFMGKYNLQQWTEKNSQARDVESVHIHPEYKSEDVKFEADLAIMVLKEEVEYTVFVRPICLWIFSDDINQIVGQTGTVVGWGRDETGSSTSEPNKVSMPIVSQEECLLSNKQFVFYTSNRTFCAGLKDGTGPCSGDSGGGFMIGYRQRNVLKWYLRGVVHLSLLSSDNRQLCDLNNYLIYTDAAKFMDWIREFVPY